MKNRYTIFTILTTAAIALALFIAALLKGCNAQPKAELSVTFGNPGNALGGVVTANPNTDSMVSTDSTMPHPGMPDDSAITVGHGGGGGACGGEGICMGVAAPNQAPNGINVEFYLLKDDPSILVMSFKADSLDKHQPQHSRFFHSAQYKFETTYLLSVPEFAKLKLPPNSRITPQDSCTIQPLKDGIMTVYIKYSHDK